MRSRAIVQAEEARVRDILRQFGTGDDEARTLTSAGPYPLVVLAGLLIFTCLAVLHVRKHPTPDGPWERGCPPGSYRLARRRHHRVSALSTVVKVFRPDWVPGRLTPFDPP